MYKLKKGEFVHNARWHDELFCKLTALARISDFGSLIPRASDRALRQLDDFDKMVRLGTKAWADVPDAADFVDNLRGNDE